MSRANSFSDCRTKIQATFSNSSNSIYLWLSKKLYFKIPGWLKMNIGKKPNLPDTVWRAPHKHRCFSLESADSPHETNIELFSTQLWSWKDVILWKFVKYSVSKKFSIIARFTIFVRYFRYTILRFTIFAGVLRHWVLL